MKSIKGNALFFILIAVCLFAALSYAITQTSRGGGADATKESDRLALSDYLSYAESVASSVMRLRLASGCLETQLDFGNPIMVHPTYWGGSSNSQAPANGSCDVFGVGGGLPYREVLDIENNDNYPFISHEGSVEGVGTTASDLILFVTLAANKPRSLALCREMNARLGNTGPATGETLNLGDWGYARGAGLAYDATPSTGQTIGDDVAGSAFIGKMTGCVERLSHGTNTLLFYYVLLAR